MCYTNCLGHGHGYECHSPEPAVPAARQVARGPVAGGAEQRAPGADLDDNDNNIVIVKVIFVTVTCL